jgi:transcription antitermination factor NusG
LTWIVITAEPSKLRKVRRRLRRKGYQAYLPAIARVRAIAKGSKVKRRRVLTPLMSYILVKAPCDSIFDLWLYDVTSTKDVRGYLKTADRPALVPDLDIQALKAKVKWLRFESEARTMKRRLRSGMKARVKEGTLAGKAGTVQWVRGAKAGLEAQLFGSMRVVEVKAKDLEAA